MQVLFLSALILYFAKTLLIPLFFGLLIAMVMFPICKWLEERKWQKSMAILTCLFIVTLLFAVILILLIWQINLFSKDAPRILHKIENEMLDLKAWMISRFGWNSNLESNWKEKIANSLGGFINTTFQTTISTFFTLFLIPVFAALFLYHRKIFIEFLQLITPVKHQLQLSNILKQTIHTYFNYIKGMILVYIIVGVLNSLGLWALGVEHALLFGMLCAIMTIIPYVGIFVSSLLPISVVWMQTGNIIYPIGVIAVFSFVQFLEANIIFPKVVGTQLHVSTLAMLVAIILGGIIWGVSGMVLFIPFVAILKIISDNIPEWRPINMLLSRK